jgi:hypothetical protein
MPFAVDEDCQSDSKATTTIIGGVDQKHNKTSTTLKQIEKEK